MAQLYPPGTPAPEWQSIAHEIEWYCGSLLDGVDGDRQTRSVRTSSIRYLSGAADFAGPEWDQLRLWANNATLITIEVPGAWLRSINAKLGG